MASEVACAGILSGQVIYPHLQRPRRGLWTRRGAPCVPPGAGPVSRPQPAPRSDLRTQGRPVLCSTAKPSFRSGGSLFGPSVFVPKAMSESRRLRVLVAYSALVDLRAARHASTIHFLPPQLSTCFYKACSKCRHCKSAPPFSAPQAPRTTARTHTALPPCTPHRRVPSGAGRERRRRPTAVFARARRT